MTAAEVTILIPNYKTLLLTKLCLRLLRKNTNLHKAKIIVIDNDSEDESLEYLKTLSWIDLIERPKIPGEAGMHAHSAALDLGLARVTTPYVLSIHTDTLIKNPNWLEYLIKEINKNPLIAGVGSWKLENKNFLQRWAKNIEYGAQTSLYRLLGKQDHALNGIGKNYYYLRSHCAMYRTQLLHDLSLNFSAGGDTAGKVMHKELVDAGYQMKFLTSEVLSQYLDHLNHATVVLNPEFNLQNSEMKKGMKRIQMGLKKLNAEQILADESLDVI